MGRPRKMATFVIQPPNGHATLFKIDGAPVVFCHSVHDIGSFSLRVYCEPLPWAHRFWIELRHQKDGRIIESLAQRQGVEGLAEAVRAIQGLRLSAETNAPVKGLVDALRAQTLICLTAYPLMPTEEERLKRWASKISQSEAGDDPPTPPLTRVG